MDEERYKVVLSSVSGHCCFEATVVDTHTPFMSGASVIREYTDVCECLEATDAVTIAKLLNDDWARGAHERRLDASDDPQQTGG